MTHAYFSFEKMISGMYLGELARVALKEMAQQGLLFGGQTGLLEERGRFSTRFMSDIGRYAVSFSQYSISRRIKCDTFRRFTIPQYHGSKTCESTLSSTLIP